MVATPSPETSTLTCIRRFLLLSLALGVIGTAGELVLLGHIESPAQWLPLVALVLSIPLLLWHARWPGKASVRMLQLLMIVFVAFGLVGVGLHYDGNAEFERELHPDDAGMTYLGHVVAGATPVLAPGSMVLLGLVGMAHAYRHPSAAAGVNRQERVS
jgi:hypothetical protein